MGDNYRSAELKHLAGDPKPLSEPRSIPVFDGIKTVNVPYLALMPDEFVLTLPIPPSVNAMYRNVAKRGRVKTAAYKAWIVEADQWFMAQRRRNPIISEIEFTRPCEIAIRVPAKMRGDISNRIKAAEDYLVSRGITRDDKHNRKVSIERDESLTDYCVIIVTGMVVV